jgi:hypothetical protein
MATRPIFIVETKGPALVREELIDFVWHAGMAKSQRRMCMRSLHEAAQAKHQGARILEVSRMSDNSLGEQLSAFNLKLEHKDQGREVSVECVYQASKVFERGGPFLDLLTAMPGDAKTDLRLQESGRLIAFNVFGEDWPTEPSRAFYDWIYMNALDRHRELAFAVNEYDIFTDIVFNPAKSINCQARSVALYVALVRRGELPAALSSRDAFLRMQARESSMNEDQSTQGSLF